MTHDDCHLGHYLEHRDGTRRLESLPVGYTPLPGVVTASDLDDLPPGEHPAGIIRSIICHHDHVGTSAPQPSPRYVALDPNTGHLIPDPRYHHQ